VAISPIRRCDLPACLRARRLYDAVFASHFALFALVAPGY